MKTPREEVLSCYSHLSVAALDELLGTFEARHDAANASIVREAISKKGSVQTEELSNSGQLFKHTRYDSETGRVTHHFTGDIGALLAPFTTPGIRFRLNHKLAARAGMNAEQARAYAATQRTVTVGPGERVRVFKD